jgi:glycosyltransferase involved in cell wall biosynthesis
VRVVQAHNRHASRGGADDVLDREAALLRAAGHEVEQLLVEPGGSRGALADAAASVWNAGAVAELEHLMTRFRPDVLHVHTPFPVMSPAVFRAAHRKGVGTVATVHSFRYSCIVGTLRRDGQICEKCVGRVAKLAGVRHRCYHGSAAASLALTTSLVAHRGTLRHHVDRFLPLTEFSAGILERDGIAPSHITVKPNCVDDPGRPTPADRRGGGALYVGRLVEEKGIATLLAAWREHDPGISLTIVGDGPLRASVDAFSEAHPHVQALGWREPDEVSKLQATADLVVVPSEWYEAGPPLVMLQALASGTPVVSSDLANISGAALAAGAAVGFPPGDAEGLASAVETVAGDAQLRGRLGTAARELYLRSHTPAHIVSTLESVYAEVAR